MNIKPCIKCGAIERNARGQCKPCNRASSVKWRNNNPEKAKAKDAAYYAANTDKMKTYKSAWNAANREKINAGARKCYAANPEKRKAYTAAIFDNNPRRFKERRAAYYAANKKKASTVSAAWRVANPEARRIHHQNRRARKGDAGGKLSLGLADRLFTLQRGKCACGCRQPLGDDYHLDHRMPLALGGTNEDSNMQLLRKTCNLQKHAKHPIDFMQQRGFLL